MRILVAPAVVVCLLLGGCHRVPSTGDRQGSLGSVITRDQIDSSGAANIYDVIARLHADFLRDRGRISIKTNTHERAMVFLNEQEYGIPETMRNIPAGRIEEVRFFGSTDAAVRFGAQYGGGVIQLISRTH